MPNWLIRTLTVIASLFVIAAATHANVIHAGGYHTDTSALIIALAVMLSVGMAFAVVSFTDGRAIFATILGICLISGEAYWVLTNAEREIADREAKARPLIEAQRTREKAAQRVEAAGTAVANAPDTSPRLEAALANKKEADDALVAKSAEMGCAKNCANLLQQLVDQAQAEVDAARAELSRDKKAAKAELAAARAAFAILPSVPSSAPLPERIGVQPWFWDLVLAGLRSLAVVGASIAIGMAVHPKKAKAAAQQPAAAEMAAARAQRMQVIEPPSKKPAQPVKSRAKSATRTKVTAEREHVSRFLCENIVPDPAGSLSLRALSRIYPEWCKDDPLPMEQLGAEMRALFSAAGLRYEVKDGDLIVHGASIRHTIASAQSDAA